MNGLNGLHVSSVDHFDELVRKLLKTIKKLEEIKVKIIDLQTAKRELNNLIENVESEIIHKIEMLELMQENE